MNFNPAAERSSCETMVTTMKKKLAVILAALLAAGVLVNPSAKAIGIEINLGDRPYYEGRSYWEDGYEWVFVPGHFDHGRWIHGDYERRGEWRREHAHEHHEHHHHHDHDEHH
jgi:hypothetical protein